jgi:hypothetical protein
LSAILITVRCSTYCLVPGVQVNTNYVPPSRCSKWRKIICAFIFTTSVPPVRTSESILLCYPCNVK